MASIRFTVQVEGQGSVDLPVEVTDPLNGPAMIDGLGSTQIHFRVTNPLPRAVVFPSIVATLDGAQAGKLTATLLQNAMTIAVGGAQENVVTIEANEAFLEIDSAQVTIEATEG